MNLLQDDHRKLISLVLVGVMLAAFFSGCEVDAPDTQNRTGVPIAKIQGAGHVSSYLNQTVDHVHGIVTAVRPDGFYMQSVRQDDDPATSEGIFVFKGLIPGVKPGDEVLVSAMVEEWVPGGRDTGNLATTQLMYPSIKVLSSGNISIPALPGGGISPGILS